MLQILYHSQPSRRLMQHDMLVVVSRPLMIILLGIPSLKLRISLCSQPATRLCERSHTHAQSQLQRFQGYELL